MSTIHIKGEAVPLKVFDTTVYESLYLQLYTSTVTVGTTKFKIRPLNNDNLIAKAGVIRGAITHLASRENMDIVPFVSPARRRVDSSDSDDGVDIPDKERRNPFEPLDFLLLKRTYVTLHKSYWQARDTSFQNAYGKFFFSDSLLSTSSSGMYQPGALKLLWITDAPETRGRNNCSVKATLNRVSDFCVWDSISQIYYIVEEIKSKDDKPALFQTKEQMVGLLKVNQTTLLGLVVWPKQISPIILKWSNTRKEISWLYLEELNVDDNSFFR